MGQVVTGAFWQGRRVFLTGHTGFKGSWMTLWLSSLGAEVFGYALPPEGDQTLFDTTGAAELCHHTIGDIRDAEHLRRALASSQAEVVIHMAAQPLVLRSYEDPVETYATNVMGTVHLLEAVRATPSVKSVVVITTDKCYENREWIWGYREDDPMGGYDPYSSSKGCTELVVSAYRRSFLMKPGHERQVAIASARAGNVIGGGDWARDRLVPDIMAALMEGRRPLLRRPGSVRPWQHVLEPLRGYLMLAQDMAEGKADRAGAWNFGPGDDDHASVVSVANRLCDLWGLTEGPVCLENNSQPHEASLLKLDCSKARIHLGWTPRWDLDAALGNIVAWYRAYQAGEDMRAVTMAQIATYTNAQAAPVSLENRMVKCLS